MNDPNEFKDIPVSIFLAITIIIVFSLYFTTAIKTIPCGKTIMSAFYSNFVHTDIYHLVGNMVALYALSRVERSVGIKSFIILIAFLLIFNSIVDVVIHKTFPNIPCSIGFSGILFGVLTWEMITTKDLDIFMFLSIVFMVALPSIQNPKASLSGHAIGAVSGIIGGLLWTKLYKNKIKSVPNNKWKRGL